MLLDKTFRLPVLFFLILLVLSVFSVIFHEDKPLKIQPEFPVSAVDPQIRLNFSVLMDTKSVESAFSLEPAVLGNFSWSGKMLLFTPLERLEFSQQYTLKLQPGFKDISGKEYLGEREYSFQTRSMGMLYLDARFSDGMLYRYDIASKKKTPLSPPGYRLKNYDYNGLRFQIVALANHASSERENANEEGPLFYPYLFDLQNSHWEPIDVFHDDDYVINSVQWIPFENAVLVSRTRVYGPKPDDAGSLTDLVRYDLDTKEISLVLNGANLRYDIFLTPDGLGMMYLDDDGNLSLYNFAKQTREFLATDFFNYYGFSPYGKYLFYSVLNDFGVMADTNTLVLQSRNGSQKTFYGDIFIDFPSFAPDENALVFLSTDSDNENFVQRNSQLVLSDISQDGLVFLTDPKAGSVDDPLFSPDSKSISFLQFPIDAQEYVLRAGWDQNEHVLVGASLKLMNLEDKSVEVIHDSVAEVRWMY